MACNTISNFWSKVSYSIFQTYKVLQICIIDGKLYLRIFKRLELIERIPRDWNSDMITLVWYRRLLNMSALPRVDESGLRLPEKNGSIIRTTATVAPKYFRKKSWIMPNHQFSRRTRFRCSTRASNLCIIWDASLLTTIKCHTLSMCS